MNYNNVKQFELEEAKKRMFGGTAEMMNSGMTNTVNQYAQLESAEKLQAKEEMNKTNTMY